jgi:hypothetical protein
MRWLAITALLAACSGDGSTSADAALFDIPPTATPRETIMEDVPLVVDEIVEAIMTGGAGDYAHITMTADGAPIDWNLHGHAGGGTQVVNEELRVRSVDYVFHPTDTADWFLLIRNKGQTDITVKLQIDLYENMIWKGWQ